MVELARANENCPSAIIDARTQTDHMFDHCGLETRTTVGSSSSNIKVVIMKVSSLLLSTIHPLSKTDDDAHWFC